MSEQFERALGRIEGRLKGMSIEQRRQGKAIVSIDTRLGTVETQSAKYGAVSGGLMATVLLVGGEFIKKKLGI